MEQRFPEMAANLIAASCFAWCASQIPMQRVRQNNPMGKSGHLLIVACLAPLAKKISVLQK
jgi:hypothetical protein